ncbi:uncharacterized protein LOC127749416 [Frankliniella occidentalis]|uniref:Uncharacterized protein LOC127749416 n=1 Tax=Frankliniella occidentalis TaxID=133901 RepID=A0A9C6WXU8_FRAOC|nr:uncharacterized protein LOC127749416 [Frankliniella occidentalis]
MADIVARVKKPFWVLLAIAWCCALAAAADTDASSGSPEATTAAISSLAYDSVTVQDTRPADDKASHAGGEDEKEATAPAESPAVEAKDVGAPTPDVKGAAEKSPSADTTKGVVSAASSSINATAAAPRAEHGAGETDDDDDDDDDEDDVDDEDEEGEEDGEKRVEASTSKSVKITVSKVTGSGKGPEGEKRSLEAEVVVPGPAGGATASTEKTKLAGEFKH